MRAAGSDESDVFLGGEPGRTSPYAQAPQLTDEVTWGLREIFYGFMIALAGLVLSIAIIAEPFVAIYGTDSWQADAASAVSQILLDLIAVGGVFYLIRQKGSTYRALGIRKPEPPGQQGLAAPEGYPWGFHAGMIGVGLVLAYICLFSYVALVSVLGLHFLEPDNQIPENYLKNNVVTAILALGVVLVAPVCEELFFRGFVFGGMRRLWGFVIGGIVSGLLFSTAHAQPGLIIPFAGHRIRVCFLVRPQPVYLRVDERACLLQLHQLHAARGAGAGG